MYLVIDKCLCQVCKLERNYHRCIKFVQISPDSSIGCHNVYLLVYERSLVPNIRQVLFGIDAKLAVLTRK